MWELIAPVDETCFKNALTSDSCFDGKQSAAYHLTRMQLLGRPRVSSGGVSGKHCVDTHFSYARKKSSISQKSVMMHRRTPFGGRNETLSLHYTKRVLFNKNSSIIYQTHVNYSYNYLDALKRRGYNPRQRRWGRCSLTNCPHIFGLYYNCYESCAPTYCKGVFL